MVDLSESSRKYMDTYINSFDKVAGQLQGGDILVVISIDSQSTTDPLMPINAAIPVFEAKNSLGQTTDSPLLVQKYKQEYTAGLDALKKELSGSFRSFVIEPSIGSRAKNTEIIGALTVAESIFSSYKKNENALLIMSDMIQDSRDLNLSRSKITDSRTSMIIQTEKDRGSFPHFDNTRAYCIAASALDSDRYFQLKAFWLRYFAEAGAEVTFYGDTLITF